MRVFRTSSWLRVALAAVAVLIGGVRSHAQFEKMVSTTFDGWNKLPDGSYELVFGYMNRNATEVEVPLGARFSAPGTYWLRVVAAGRSASNAVVKVVVTP